MNASALLLAQDREPKFAIGQRFYTAGKHPRTCTVVDILKTYNSQGKMIRIRYVANHEFMGRIVTDWDVVETTIARGLIQ